MSGPAVEQSGSITPGHLAQWVAQGVIEDAGPNPFTSVFGMYSSGGYTVNFNVANTDTPIYINLPTGYTRYRVHGVVISGASASLTSATCGVFTATGGGGVQVVAANTAITVSAITNDTNNNMQNLTIANQNTIAFSDTILYFRVETAQGSAATGSVTIFFQPMP